MTFARMKNNVGISMGWLDSEGKEMDPGPAPTLAGFREAYDEIRLVAGPGVVGAAALYRASSQIASYFTMPVNRGQVDPGDELWNELLRRRMCAPCISQDSAGRPGNRARRGR